VMTREPYASARRVFWIVDNGSSHRGWTAAARLADAFPNAVMIRLFGFEHGDGGTEVGVLIRG
jgi:hypothetical protein